MNGLEANLLTTDAAASDAMVKAVVTFKQRTKRGRRVRVHMHFSRRGKQPIDVELNYDVRSLERVRAEGRFQLPAGSRVAGRSLFSSRRSVAVAQCKTE
jgi:hypothetical protein